MTSILIVFTLLVVKHFVIDFPLQTSYQWMNKGKYGHLGGVLHASLHGVGTFLCFAWLIDPVIALSLALFDAIIHYHIDWAKVNINNRFNWHPQFNPEFWWLLGLDQLLHYLTYILMIYFIM